MKHLKQLATSAHSVDKRMIKYLLLLLLSTPALAQDFTLNGSEFGSNTPADNVHAVMVDRAAGVGVYHAPQYLPGHPTAATIWPRVVPVKCVEQKNKIECENYKWLPEMGRPEYIFVTPVLEKNTPPQNVPPVIIIREVAKKKGAG